MNSRGFTLIEVLVALGIFALATVALGATYANVIAGYRQAGSKPDREQEMLLVREAIAREPERAKVGRGGAIALPGQHRAQWSANLLEGNLPGLFRVELQCSFDGSGSREPEVVREIFMLFRPGWSDPAGHREFQRARHGGMPP